MQVHGLAPHASLPRLPEHALLLLLGRKQFACMRQVKRTSLSSSQ